jgi:hypothetical protein
VLFFNNIYHKSEMHKNKVLRKYQILLTFSRKKNALP